MWKPINRIKLSSRGTDQTTETTLIQEMAACLFSRKRRSKGHEQELREELLQLPRIGIENYPSWKAFGVLRIIYLTVIHLHVKKKLDSLISVAAALESQRPKRRLKETRYFIQIWWRSAKSSDQVAGTIIDIGWKKGRAKLSERNELCVSMAIKMKDVKSSQQALVYWGIFTFNQIIANLSRTVTVWVSWLF